VQAILEPLVYHEEPMMLTVPPGFLLVPYSKTALQLVIDFDRLLRKGLYA